MIRVRIRYFVPAFAAGAVVLAAACTTAQPTSQELTVTARDIAYAQNQLTLRAGVPTRLVFVNEGAIEHDITIPGLSAGETADAHGHQEASHDMGTMAAGTVHATASVGDRAMVEFIPKAGTYEFACTIPGHKEAGMVGTLRVQ